MAGGYLTEAEGEETLQERTRHNKRKYYRRLKRGVMILFDMLPPKSRGRFLSLISSDEEEFGDDMRLMTPGVLVDDDEFSAKVTQWYKFSRRETNQTIDELLDDLVQCYKVAAKADEKEAWGLFETIFEEGTNFDDFLKSRAREKLPSPKMEEKTTDRLNFDKGGDGISESFNDLTELKTQCQFNEKVLNNDEDLDFPSSTSKLPQVFLEQSVCQLSDKAASCETVSTFPSMTMDEAVVKTSCPEVDEESEGDRVFEDRVFEENEICQSDAGAYVNPIRSPAADSEHNPEADEYGEDYNGPVCFPPDYYGQYLDHRQIRTSSTLNNCEAEYLQEVHTTSNEPTDGIDIARPGQDCHTSECGVGDDGIPVTQLPNCDDESSIEVLMHSVMSCSGFSPSESNSLEDSRVNSGARHDSLQSIGLIIPVQVFNEHCPSTLATATAEFEFFFQNWGQVIILPYGRKCSSINCSA